MQSHERVVEECAGDCSIDHYQAMRHILPWFSCTSFQNLAAFRTIEIQIRKVLSLFWGETRWLRLKLH